MNQHVEFALHSDSMTPAPGGHESPSRRRSSISCWQVDHAPR